MQDEYGRPLSDDGQWVWDGSAWRPTAGGAPGGPGPDPGTVGLEPTMVAPRDYDPTGGQSQQPYGQGGYGAQPGGPQGPGGAYGPGPAGAYRPGGSGGQAGPGGPKGPTPFYQKPTVIIGALLVLSAVLVTIILLTRGGGSPAAGPTPTVAATTPAPPTEVPTTEPPTTEPPTTAPPTTVPPTTPPPTSSLPSTISTGLYDCTSGGAQIGTATFAGTAYRTSTGATGTYQYDALSGDISFTGGDLGDFTGAYDPSGPSMELTSASGGELRCAQ